MGSQVSVPVGGLRLALSYEAMEGIEMKRVDLLDSMTRLNRDKEDTQRQVTEAAATSSKVEVKPAPLRECERLGIEVTWFTPKNRESTRDMTLVFINAFRVTLNKHCRQLLGEVPLKVDIARQGKGFLVLRFSDQGNLPVQDHTATGAYAVSKKGLIPWLTEQGVKPGAYPVEWDSQAKCLYLKLAHGIFKKSRRDKDA